ncbi:CPBP family intramembrane glutamic endopeptidase [Actinopolyspora sp. H202]|uniref:CPBP family intramembrane glutamic endopeptidase n=1 Tax=Actinopolyspora sp. H202 TaxID=1500456 RepID=UPI003EE5DCD1
MCGLAVLVAAPLWLLLTGHTSFRGSADEGAPPMTLWQAMLPPLVGIALTRMVPLGLTETDPFSRSPRALVFREMWVILVAALAFPTVIAVLPAGASRGVGYAALKVLLFLVVPLVAFRLLRGEEQPTAAIPFRVPRLRWLAPLPAVLAWFYLSRIGPLAPPPYPAAALPDPVTLAVVSLVTLLTAGVLEEVFYRGFLQTRLESLLGRWLAIMVSSLLFAAMHLPTHLHSGSVVTGLATVLVFQGLFGVFCGYLWSRYRNIWIVIAVHIVVNLAYVDLLLGWLGR